MNEFQQEILDDLKEVSPNIKDYLDNKLYDNEFEDTDMVTPTAIFNLVMGMADQELVNLGIELSSDADVRHDVDSIQLVRDLRILFDRANLLKTLMDTRVEIDNILDEAFGDELKQSTFIHTLLDALYEFPSVEALVDRIKNVSHMFSSDYGFLRHVQVRYDVAKDMLDMEVPDNAAEFLTQATTFIQQSVERYRLLHEGGINVALVNKHMLRGANKVLATIPNQYWSLYLDPADTNPFYYKGDDPGEVSYAKKASNVFLEHYKNNDLEPKEEFVKIIACLAYRESWTSEDYKIWLRDFNLSETLEETLMIYFDLLGGS